MMSIEKQYWQASATIPMTKDLTQKHNAAVHPFVMIVRMRGGLLEVLNL